MAKKKSAPKKKSSTKKAPKKDVTEKKESLPEFEIKPLTKTDYLFGMIKRAFGYEWVISYLNLFPDKCDTSSTIMTIAK